MNPRNIYTLLLCLSTTFIFSQNFSISGEIQDKARLPIAYANILLLKAQDSSVVNGTTSDDNGGFILNNIQSDNYILKTSFIGFESDYLNIDVKSNMSISVIILKELAETLSEIEITVRKPTLRKEADRLVFNVERTALSEGNMMEVLRSTPSVLVLDNAITVKGSSPTVYINDRKVQLSGEELMQLLESSPANIIKSVEVITNPGAKYDAESGVVLNIVMSKNLITGYRGNVFTNYTQGIFPRYNAGITNFYKTKKINVFANYSYTQSKLNRDNVEKINFLNDQRWNSNINRNTRSKTHNFNLNFDYFIDDNNTIGLSSNVLFLPDFEYVTKGKTIIRNSSGILQSSFDSNNLSNDEKLNVGVDLDFVHKFNNKGKLSLNAHVTKYDYQRNQDVLSNYFLSDSTPDFSTAFNTDANQETNIFTAQLDYDVPMGETASFSSGIKGSQIKTKSDITQFDIINNQSVLNLNNTDEFDYEEDILAAYVSFEKQWDKWDLSAGLRLEQTNIKGISLSTSQMNKQDYLEWFPSINLSHQASDNVKVYSTYKRSIERPGYQYLNPFQFFFNDNAVVAGNPDLRPAFIDHFTIGTSIKNKYIFEAYYKKTNAKFFEFPTQNNQDNIIVYKTSNISSLIDFGFDFFVDFDISNRWQASFLSSFYNIQEEANFNNNLVKLDKWSNYSEFSNNITFLKDKSLAVNFVVTYIQENVDGLQLVSSWVYSSLSLRKLIFKKRGSLSLSILDLFNEHDVLVSTKFLDQDNSNFSNLDNRYIKLGFSYRFGNTNLETNERTKEREERKRLENN